MRAQMRYHTRPKRPLEEMRSEVFCCLGEDGEKALQEEQQLQRTHAGA